MISERIPALDRDILRLAIPALATLVAEPLYVLTDTAIVGHLGTAQLAGLALASTVLLTSYVVFVFLAYGTTAAVGRLLGAGEDRAAADQALQGMWLATVLGVVVALFAGVAGTPLLRLLGGQGDVLGYARTYLRVSLAGFPALLVSMASVGYLRARQDVRAPLAVALGTALLNLALEWWWIFGLGFGVGASALATVVAQWVGAAVFVARVVPGARRLGTPLRPRLSAMRGLLAVGLHLVARTAALRGSFTLGTAVASRMGPVELAAYQVGFEVWSFLALALDALAIAAQALVARRLGAGDVAGARAVGVRVNRWGLVVGMFFALAVLVLRGPLAALFSDDDAVVELAAFSLLYVAAMQPVNGWVFALDGTLIAAGDQRYMARAMAVAAGAFLPAALAVWVSGSGLGWLWAALGWFMVARLVVLEVRFRGEHWAVAGARR